jgi:hypothetical protein
LFAVVNGLKQDSKTAAGLQSWWASQQSVLGQNPKTGDQSTRAERLTPSVVPIVNTTVKPMINQILADLRSSVKGSDPSLQSIKLMTDGNIAVTFNLGAAGWAQIYSSDDGKNTQIHVRVSDLDNQNNTSLDADVFGTQQIPGDAYTAERDTFKAFATSQIAQGLNLADSAPKPGFYSCVTGNPAAEARMRIEVPATTSTGADAG